MCLAQGSSAKASRAQVLSIKVVTKSSVHIHTYPSTFVLTISTSALSPLSIAGCGLRSDKTQERLCTKRVTCCLPPHYHYVDSNDQKYDKFRSVCSCSAEFFGSLYVRTDEGYEPNECKQRLTSWHGMCMSCVLQDDGGAYPMRQLRSLWACGVHRR